MTETWDTLPTILTPPEAASLLRVSETTVIRLCRRGQLPCSHIGLQWRIDREQLREMFDVENPALPIAKI